MVMLRYSERTNTLYLDEYQYELQDVESPNLYRDLFPYDSVPRCPFNHRSVPINPPDEIWITDTTFRDGQQSRPPYTVKQVVDLYDFLHRLGGRKGLIRQCEFFLYSDKDREAVEQCRERGYKYPEITGWIRPIKKDFQLVKDMGLKETGILTSTSDYHIFLKLGKKRSEALEMYLDIVRAALDVGVTPRCHFEDITRADFYGFIIPFARELMNLAEEARTPIKIRACDTLGLGVAYPGASLPRNVRGIVYGLNHFANVPSEWIEWHGHNDFYRAVNNAVNAWRYGASAANGTLLGIGERTGNTPIEALVVEYMSLRGDDGTIDTTVITEIAEYYEREVGYSIPPNQPFVGRDFTLTCAGIHQDGILKNEETYNIFDTEKLLKRPLRVAITDKSGAAGVAHWINSRLKLGKDKALGKDHPAVVKIKQWVDEEYHGGRTTAISDEEMLEAAKRELPEYFW